MKIEDNELIDNQVQNDLIEDQDEAKFNLMNNKFENKNLQINDMKKMKIFVDEKYQEILKIIDNDSSLDMIHKAKNYSLSLEYILNAILKRREIEAKIKADKLNLKEIHHTDSQDLSSIKEDIAEK